ncbi:MAG: hypothetical protein JW700_01065 [Candidatus Aenigmarchaeota archaeon]|nr:hypothetical protein [Candidatus Aenigmarchaeota archaeon]
MKKLLPLVILLLSVNAAFAMPVIQDFSIDPQNPWIGTSVDMELLCTDNANMSIEQVYAQIEGPEILLPILYFSGNINYQLSLSEAYLDRIGTYDVTVYCKNNVSNITSQASSFTVSSLSGYIGDIRPVPAYIGDTIEIDFVAEKDGARITHDVLFNVTLDGVLKNLKVVPAYDITRGWILKLDTPGTRDVYDVSVTMFYEGASVTDYGSADVRNSIEFEIASVSKTWIKSKDNITVSVLAMDKGNMISLDQNDIGIKIGGTSADVTGFSLQGNYYVISIMAPPLSPGSYQLEASMSHESKTYSANKQIEYAVVIDGELVDENNKAISTKIKFNQNDINKLTVSTDAYGKYGGLLPPGVYDIVIDFPKSQIELSSVTLSEFDDPINYFYGDETEIPGIRNAGLYGYEIGLDYSTLELEMDYDEGNVIDEDELKVFRCSDWSMGKQACSDEWEEIGYDIDMIRNNVRITASGLSAFVIGEVKSLKSVFSTDKKEYNLDETIKVSGITKDEDGDVVGNTTVFVAIKNTQESITVKSDDNGVFSVELDVPKNEAEYVVSVDARKEPYSAFNGETKISVVKSKSVFIDFPETVRIERGGSSSYNFTIVNDGQDDLTEMLLYLEGISQDYYTLQPDTISLKVGESRDITLDISIPVYMETGIRSVTLKSENNEITQELVFGLNVFETGEQETVPTTGLATGFTLPQISYYELAFVGIFAAVCFSLAILLKKRKKFSNRGEIRSFLIGVRKYMSTDGQPMHPNTGSYDKLIITEFPNVLKFSKNLTQKGD